MLVTYLLAFRSCITSNVGSSPAPPVEPPKEGKFETLRSAPSKSRLQTFRFAPEHKDLTCPVCEEGLDKRGLLVKVLQKEERKIL